MNTRKIYWLAQLIGWFSYSGLIVFSIYNSDPQKIDTVLLLNVFTLTVVGIAITHTQRAFCIRMGWLGIRLPRLIPRLVVTSFVASVAITVIDNGTDCLHRIVDPNQPDFSFDRMVVNVLAMMLLVLFWNALYFTVHFFQKSRRQEISNLELRASNKEGELKNLREQLNPHFLFNSLNSIRALIDIDPVKAKTSISTLSNLLRQSLLLGRENLVTLESEVDLAKSYLSLEKVRFEERLEVCWNISPSLNSFLIPPFSLQMMVENAVKHGVSVLPEGGLVNISATQTDQFVIIKVDNPGALSNLVDLGVGVQNIKQRLALQYGNGAHFILEERKGRVYSQMNFRQDEAI
ncbi:MAG: histidine kinase [Crocinitomicaceae bacterium]|nr:histidine kinase [Crocinitomicaceae bacterium]MDG1777260.1 histidine kinase [Crocinitomicaceae bacterium]